MYINKAHTPVPPSLTTDEIIAIMQHSSSLQVFDAFREKPHHFSLDATRYLRTPLKEAEETSWDDPQKAIRLCQAIANDTQHEPYTIAYAYEFMGDLLKRQSPADALASYTKSLETYVQAELFSDAKLAAQTILSLYHIPAIQKQFLQIHSKRVKEQEKLRGLPGYNQQHEMMSRYLLLAAKNLPPQQEWEYRSALCFLEQAPLARQGITVEERQVAYTDSRLLSTHNIQSCVAVIIRDPHTKKTAMAHINSTTTQASLADVLKEFPTDREIQIRLVGARSATDEGKKNVQKIVEVLRTCPNARVISADILTAHCPSAIIYNPIDGRLSHGVIAIKPGSHAALYPAANSLGVMPTTEDSTAHAQIPLHTSITLVSGKHIKQPLLLNPRSLFNLYNQDYICQDNAAVYRYFKDALGPQAPGHLISSLSLARDANNTATEHLMTTVSHCCKEHYDVEINPISLRYFLLSAPKYIGKHAEEHNATFIERYAGQFCKSRNPGFFQDMVSYQSPRASAVL